jgi:transposase InsO family protein
MFNSKEDRLRKFGEIKDIGNKKQYLPIYSDTPYAFQIDLTFFDSTKRLNDGYNVLFTAINVNTRFAYAYYSKDKSAKTITGFITSMEEKTVINSITCDEGSEFTNRSFRKFCEDKNIQLYFTKNDKYKLGIVNRFHRTLKDKLREISETDPKFRWIDYR